MENIVLEKLKKIFRNLLPRKQYTKCCEKYYLYSLKLSELWYKIIGPKYVDPYQVPIIINNLNRLTDLKKLIASLEKRGYNNIHILDNDSSYPPLLEYYQNCKYEITRLKKNYGFRAIWESGEYKKYKKSYYVYTDSDLELMENCPDDFMFRFIDIFKRYPECAKVGFGICIDDLPNVFELKEKVISHESKFWSCPVERGVYYAIIDTTFALYRPYTQGASSPYKIMFRTGEPYMVRHLPWYIDTHNLNEEEVFYLQSVKQSTHWARTLNKNINR